MGRLEASRSSKVLLVLGAIALGTPAAFFGTASGASIHAAQKEPITQVTHIECDGNQTPGLPTQSFANIRLGGGPGGISNVVADVSLRNAAPNKQYEVDLNLTGGLNNCSGASGTIVTNGQGNGNTTVTAVKQPGTTGAFVSLLAGGNPPTNLVSAKYVFGNK